MRMVLRRCERETQRAGKAAKVSQAKEDLALLEWAKDSEKSVRAKAATRIQDVWRMIRARGASIALAKVHVGDSAEGACVAASDPDFLRLVGELGTLTVEKFNRPAVRSAFDAWLELFVPRH